VLLNFRSNGLQVVALMSVSFRSFVLSIRSNVFRWCVCWSKETIFF